jgi:hypothetical protein
VIRLFLWSFAVVVTIRLKLLRGSQFCLQAPFRQPSRSGTSSHSPGEIAWAVRVASSYVPKATCLVQALAAEWILARCGYASRLHIGVARAEPSGGRGLDAHAWLECGGRVLLGGAGADRYQDLFTRDGSLE